MRGPISSAGSAGSRPSLSKSTWARVRGSDLGAGGQHAKEVAQIALRSRRCSRAEAVRLKLRPAAAPCVVEYRYQRVPLADGIAEGGTDKSALVTNPLVLDLCAKKSSR